MTTRPVRAVRVHSEQRQGGWHTASVLQPIPSSPGQQHVLSLDPVFTALLPMPWGPSRPIVLVDDPLRILVVAAPNEAGGPGEMPPLHEIVRFLLERGASVLAGGRLYARVQGDTVELWFVTDRWEDHGLRLQLYELEAEAMREFPDVFIDLHVTPSCSVESVPGDAHPVA